jgi:hypothetical protein
MGTWSTAIFGNDMAADVRGMCRELLEHGRTDDDATTEVLARFRDSLSDSDDAASVWTALAAVQHKLGRRSPSVRKRAIEIIDSGGDLHLWDDAKLRERRRSALLKLRADLVGPERTRVAVRRPRRKPSPVLVGQVFQLRLDDGRPARFRVIGIDEGREADCPIVELVDDRGRVYEETGEWLKGRWKRAQFELVAPRWKDLPAQSDIEIVGSDDSDRSVVFERGYLSWATLRDFVAALFDDPSRLRIRP